MPYYNIPQVQGAQPVTSYLGAERQRAGTTAIELANENARYEQEARLPANEALAARQAAVEQKATEMELRERRQETLEQQYRQQGEQLRQQNLTGAYAAAMRADLAPVKEYERVLAETGSEKEAQIAAEMMDAQNDALLRAQYPELAELPPAPRFEYGPTKSILEGYGIYDPTADAMADAKLTTEKARAGAYERQGRGAGPAGGRGSANERRARFLADMTAKRARGEELSGEEKTLTYAYLNAEFDLKSRSMKDSMGNVLRDELRGIDDGALGDLADYVGMSRGSKTNLLSSAKSVKPADVVKATSAFQDIGQLSEHVAFIANIIEETPEALALPGAVKDVIANATRMAGGDSAKAARIIEARALLEKRQTELYTVIKTAVDKGVFSETDWKLTADIAGFLGSFDSDVKAKAKLQDLMRSMEMQYRRNVQTYEAGGFEVAHDPVTGLDYYWNALDGPPQSEADAQVLPGSRARKDNRAALEKLGYIDLGPGDGPEGQ